MVLALIVASITVDNKVVACGYGAIEENFIGLYDIVVDEQFRNQGYGKKLILGLVNIAKDRNIKTAYLQVVDSNIVAKKLYQNLGFEKEYDYWYRIKE